MTSLIFDANLIAVTLCLNDIYEGLTMQFIIIFVFSVNNVLERVYVSNDSSYVDLN
jgi:hypothetical protein